MSTRRQFLCGLGSASLTACTCDDTPVAPETAPYLRRIDAHLHVSAAGLTRAKELMAREGIAWGVNLSGGALGHGLERQLEQTRAAGVRLSTFTSPHWADCRQTGFGPRLAESFRAAVGLGASGLKIHKALGLTVTGPDGKLLRVDSPELDALFHAAGELRAPVWIHTGDPLAFWRAPDASNERYAELAAHPDWSLFGRDVPSFDDLYAQLERRVERHPDTRFVSVHFGNCAEQPQRVASSLRKFPNLYIDTAARLPELGRHPAQLVREFFDEFQDRILFGSDLGVGPSTKPLFLGSSGATPPTAADERRFFDATRRYFETSDEGIEHPTPIQGDWSVNAIHLPRNILEKVYVTNGTRLLTPP